MKKLLLIFFLVLAFCVQTQAQWLVPHGEVFTATAHPNPGWSFVGWYDGNEFVSADNPYSWEVTSNVVLTAKFERIMLQIIIQIDPPGSGYVETEFTGDLSDAGGSVEIKAMPKFWWRFKHFNTETGITQENPITMLNKKSNVTARFEAKIDLISFFVLITALVAAFFKRSGNKQ
jgi:hypothetical protein